MKDKYGREVTGDTPISDLPKEARERAMSMLSNVTLGRLWYVHSVNAKKKGESPQPFDQWGAEMGRKMNFNFTPPSVTCGKTTYHEFGLDTQLSDQETVELLTAFGIDPIPDLSSPIEKDHAEQLGLRSGSCFVATVVFEDGEAEEVITLREWRDTVLARTVLGRLFICCYYHLGPMAANVVKASPFLRRSVKSCLSWFSNMVAIKGHGRDRAARS